MDADVFTIVLAMPREVASCAAPGAAARNGNVRREETSRGNIDSDGSMHDGEMHFIAGSENRLAAAAVRWLLACGSEKAGREHYSPVVLHGPSGTGKSHLARGVAEVRGDAVCTHGAEFARELANAIEGDAIVSLRERYRNTGLLVFEDVTQLVGRRAAQIELLNTLDELESRGVPVVITSRQAPDELTGLPPALRGRLNGGLQVPLAPPGVEARGAILAKLAETRGVQLAPAAAKLLAEGLCGTVPELQGAIIELSMTGGNRLVTTAKSHHGNGDVQSIAAPTIELEHVKKFLAARRARLQPSIKQVTTCVAKFFGLKPADLASQSRRQQVVLGRSVAIYLGRQLTGQSLQLLGKQFGGRDHTTVLYSYRTMEQRLTTDTDLRTAVSNLRGMLAGG